ncbi:hypothetical protein BH10ACT3_BH10ACT3_03010 [soil metagenome]
MTGQENDDAIGRGSPSATFDLDRALGLDDQDEELPDHVLLAGSHAGGLPVRVPAATLTSTTAQFATSIDPDVLAAFDRDDRSPAALVTPLAPVGPSAPEVPTPATTVSSIIPGAIPGTTIPTLPERIDVVDDEPVPAVDPQTETGAHRALRLATGQWGVALVAVIAGSLAWWFSNRHSLPLIYADARSHMTISRRLLDGPNHSLVQLGTVWLPLPHVLVAPFTLVTAWWRSGFAVMPVNLLCLVVEAIALFRVVLLAGRSRIGAWLAVMLLLTNPGWLYLHTTSLGEPVLFAAMLATVAGLAGWVRAKKPYSGGELALFCGLPAALAALSRYDGWAMAAAGGAFVLVVAQMRWGQWRYSLKCLRGYAVPPVIAALWWFWFNFVNWGDPLEFQRGVYSAQAQQDLLDKAGLLPDKGQIGHSIDTYVTATMQGSGRWVLAIALAGAALWAVAGRWKLRAIAPWLLVVIPVGFYVMSLYTGQIALRLGGQAGESMFNLRYGLQVLPGLAAMIGLGAAVIAGATTFRGHAGRSVAWRRPLVGVGAVVLVVGSSAEWWPAWQDVPVIAEGLQQRELGEPAWAAAEYLHQHAVVDDPDGGLIMIDDSVNPMLPIIGADLDRVSAPFSGPRWTRGQRDLTRNEWLFADTAGDGDSVAKAIAEDPDFDDEFDQVFTDGTVSVYHRKDTTT